MTGYDILIILITPNEISIMNSEKSLNDIFSNLKLVIKQLANLFYYINKENLLCRLKIIECRTKTILEQNLNSSPLAR